MAKADYHRKSQMAHRKSGFKVLMIAPTPFFADRGCHVRIYEEARALMEIGSEVTVCTYHNGRDIEGIRTERILNIPWYNKLEAGPSYHKFYLDFLLLLKALRVAGRLRPDIVHAHLHEGALIGRFIASLFKLPLIFDYQGSLSKELVQHKSIAEGSWKFELIRYLEKKLDRSADAIFASCSRSAESLRNEFGLDAAKVTNLTDGVDTNQFRPRSETAHLSESLKLPPGKTIAAYLGLLNHYQGVDLLLEAIKLVASQGVDVHFLIMGYPGVEKYRAVARDLGISDFVTFTGKVDYADASRYLSLADFAVSPKISRTEANAKILNYMACGLPTVAFESEVNREILGDLGIYARFEDSKSLASKIVEITEDKDRLGALKTKVRKKAVRDHSWSGVAERIVDCYEALCRNSHMRKM